MIVLFERLAPYPEGIERDYDHVSDLELSWMKLTNYHQWAYATNRCVYACDNMAAKIRRVNDDELRICNPHLVLSIFTAARFYIGTVYQSVTNITDC